MNQKISVTIIFFVFLTSTLQGQAPFEKYPAISYKEFNHWKFYDKSEKEKKSHHTLTIPGVFNNGDSLTIQLTSFLEKWDSSLVRIFRNKKQVQKVTEPVWFTELNVFEPVRVADINGDSLKDLKIIMPYMGNGIAAMNVRVIYFFQDKDGHFVKISFDDKMSDHRPERDFDGDNNFEIITMTLTSAGGHNYWLYNLFNYVSNDFINVNIKDDYPIMIQYLFRKNYAITDKISRQDMKHFSLKKPEGYSKSR